jgi:hypothetical protein
VNIIDYLEGIIRRLETRKSVATITAGLTKTVQELEAHMEDQIVKAEQKALAAAKALKERAEHEAEHLAASKVAQNIKALLS